VRNVVTPPGSECGFTFVFGQPTVRKAQFPAGWPSLAVRLGLVADNSVSACSTHAQNHAHGGATATHGVGADGPPFAMTPTGGVRRPSESSSLPEVSALLLPGTAITHP
jgi:hypothetical protein